LRERHLRGLEPARRRALEPLAGSPDGCTEGIMRARGFSIDFMVDLVRAGLATATSERLAMSRIQSKSRLRITDKGRKVLAT
jgi:hypothetical protein